MAEEDTAGLECLHLLVWDLDTFGVGGFVGFGVDAESGAGGGGADGLDDHFVAGQRPPAPVHGDVEEQPVLDLVPLRGTRWEVADGDRQAGAGGQRGQLGLPQPGAGAVGRATVGGDEPLPGAGVAPWPTASHHRAMVATAKAEVSWSIPTPTQPVFAARS